LIFDLDYEEMRKQNREFYLDLIKYTMHPDRIQRFADKYEMEFFEYLEILYN